MGREVQLLEDALARVTEALIDRSGGEGALSRLPHLLSPVGGFEWGVERLGEIARDAAHHLDLSVAATALIEARGDRIDRLNAENRASLDALVTRRA